MHLVLSLLGPNTVLDSSSQVKDFSLPFRNNSVFGSLLGSFSGFKFDKVFVLIERHDVFMRQWLKAQSGNISGQVILVPSVETLSQVKTLQNFINDHFDDLKGPIMIAPKDTISIAGKRGHELDFSQTDVFLETFNSSNRDYTFVKSHNNKVKLVVHKTEISDTVSTGMVIFKDKRVLSHCIQSRDKNSMNLLEAVANSLQDMTVREIKLSNTEIIVLNSFQNYKDAAYA